MSRADIIDQIMIVMDQAFDPEFGEAWNINQVAGALSMSNTFAILVDDAGNRTGPMGTPAAGFVLTRFAVDEEELLLIAVQPHLRGRGIGRRLLTYMTQDARNRGTRRVFLEMRCNNPAERIYRNFGFEPIGRRKDYYLKSNGERLDAITFGLDV